MSILKCTYGFGIKCKDVTRTVLDKISKDGYIDVSNTHFGDPCYGIKKQLVVRLSNFRTIIVNEGERFSFDKQQVVKHPTLLPLPPTVVYKIYYHIFALKGHHVLEIFEDQIKTIRDSPFYNRIDSINCCLTGDDEDNYDKLSKRIKMLNVETNGKICLRKEEFGDKTYEKFTYYAIRDDMLSLDKTDDYFICYIHTKGITHNTPQVTDWRKCMEYFLITKAERTMRLMYAHNAESAGIFLTDNPNIPNIPKHYSGNFWIAKASLLHQSFSKNPHVGSDGTGKPQVYNRNDGKSDYYAGEFFLFRYDHKGLDLFPIPRFFLIYRDRLPLSRYEIVGE